MTSERMANAPPESTAMGWTFNKTLDIIKRAKKFSLN